MRYCCERVYHIHNLNEVPETFRTKELYKKYIESGGNLIDVPMNYITEQLYEKYNKKVMESSANNNIIIK